jgi:hypothetical protein
MQNAISITTFALTEEKERCKNLIRLFVKDELISWHNITKGFIDSKFCSDDKLLNEKIDKNVKSFLNKIEKLSPEYQKIEEVNDYVPLDTNIVELIKASLNSNNISKTECITFPWF